MDEFYQFYKKCRNLTWQTLIGYCIYEFPLDVKELIHENGIKLANYTAAKTFIEERKIKTDKHALAFKFSELDKLILYDENETEEEQRFYLAHELGHFLVDFDPRFSEEQANIFATRLTMPAIVCKIENLTTGKQIADFFGMTLWRAEKRSARIRDLESRYRWNTSNLEKEYCKFYLNEKNHSY